MKWGIKKDRLIHYIASISPIGKALDLGCGFGSNSLFLVSNGFEVYAVDKNKEAIESLNLEILKQGLPIKTELGEINNLHLPENEYTLVIAINVLHFLEDRFFTELIQKIEKSLISGGVLYIKGFSGPSKHTRRRNGRITHYLNLTDFSAFKSLNCIYHHKKKITENHPPGPHKHTIIEVVFQKSTWGSFATDMEK